MRRRKLKWACGERVLVSYCGRSLEFRLDPPAFGTIVRKLMRDESAWVRLDKREREDVHPFPADLGDARCRDVLTWAEACEPICKESERRAQEAGER